MVVFCTVVVVLVAPPALIDPGSYEQVTVAVENETSVLGTVTARIADTDEKRYIGLSETESLGPNEGMLFVHATTSDREYVMPEASFPLSLVQRDMSVPLDIVFIDQTKTITRIHHAAIGEGPYSGTGKYILEVPRDWTTANNVTAGDTVTIPDSVS
jgi:Uncharacterized conserved protein